MGSGVRVHAQTSAFASALILYLLWTLVTWLLEGRTEVLRRPEAVAARLAYTIVANLLIGVAGSIWLLERLARCKILGPAQAGFGQPRSVALGVIAGGAVGGGLYAFLPNVPKEPVVLTNIFAQVFATSVAEILVCWAVVGVLVSQALAASNALGAYLKINWAYIATAVLTAALVIVGNLRLKRAGSPL